MKTFYRFALSLASIFVLGALLQWRFFNRALSLLQARSGQLTTHALGRILEHAHRSNDDLTQQAVLEGLSLAPGVVFGSVINPEHRILADTETAWVGQPIKKRIRPPSVRLWRRSLESAAQPWGSLVIAVSSGPLRRLATREATGLLVVTLLGIGLSAGLIRERQLREAAHGRSLKALEFHYQQIRHERDQLQIALARSQEAFNTGLKHCIFRVPYPLILLDGTQRILAANPAAFQRLHADAGIEGRAWHEIPALSDAGESIQTSLDRPGETVGETCSGMKLRTEGFGPQAATWLSWD